MSLRNFCQQHQLNVSTFYAKRKQLVIKRARPFSALLEWCGIKAPTRNASGLSSELCHEAYAPRT
ncbi:hypothetical protein [Vibrio parahaemolyticus]|uniref:hypothetical protein n=1 Tax=Vibrio parahaemolyticus TaxID=670 RepID=UPI003B5B31BE